MPTPQDRARLLFLIVLAYWLLSSPDPGPGLIAAPALVKSRLERQRHAHAVLNSTVWGDFDPTGAGFGHDSTPEPRYLNLTGFREEDGYIWEDLERFKHRCAEWGHSAVGYPEAASPVWQNATGIVRGLWDRVDASSSRNHSSYNLSAIAPDVTWSAWGADWSRNVTGREGKMLLLVEDDESAGTEPEELDDSLLDQAEILARESVATLTLDDPEGTGSSWEVRMHGVHWPRQGAMLFTTTSGKFAGIFALPHLATTPDFFESSQHLLNRTLDKVLTRKEELSFFDQTDPWISTLDVPSDVWNPSPHCEYLMYVQVYPPAEAVLQVQPELGGREPVVKAIQDIENELRFPQGIPQIGTPKVQMSAVVFSPDCAFFLETKGPPAYAPSEQQHLVGVKQETFLHSVTTWLIAFAFVVFGQVHLLKVQMRESCTPSTLGRISIKTVGMMLFADGLTFTASAAWSLSASLTMLPSLAVTCVSFLAMSVGIFFLSEIHKVQEPERRRQERERERERERTAVPTPTTTRPANPTTDAAAPIAATQPAQRPPSPPIIIPSDQDVDAENVDAHNLVAQTLPAPVTARAPNAAAQPSQGSPLMSMYGRFIMVGIATLFLSLAAATWRPVVRSAYFNLLVIIYMSLWVPQIHRNIYRNCRRALAWRFVVGQSVLRLLPIGYFYTLRDNFVFAEPDRAVFAVLAAWVWIQVWVLVAQAALGPRFGIPAGLLPEAWEYHPVLREDNAEAGGLPIGLVQSSRDGGGGEKGKEKEKEEKDKNKSGTKTHVIDCAICREDLEVPVLRAGVGEGGVAVAAVFARRAYMVTPCRHIFHSHCLESWMRFRLQCPICREELPPL